mmetsp:Transcript_3184/g.4501  ORF Transcript_3184/g.4501 Transcript_3184/m.4501 type:complete len:231 (+) Transcript_3184:27-719(+)|eukprot:CAMPEP_0175097488 /NCGR_PEP_ID=MMETSP0086_2-20121207/5313_1 /TAXON_ID=136419 /ORGANISM="Unknown Unknown, Strain D1" /LENGTH=230 /DNA_ID=CAMNT_0016371001 /DNA_START=107 /DNA_END=799 /DNA_ORIENTATION=+
MSSVSVIKLTFLEREYDVRRINLCDFTEAGRPFESLVKFVRKTYNLPSEAKVLFKYNDDENDEVTVAEEDGLETAREVVAGMEDCKCLRLSVHCMAPEQAAAHTPPAEQPNQIEQQQVEIKSSEPPPDLHQLHFDLQVGCDMPVQMAVPWEHFPRGMFWTTLHKYILKQMAETFQQVPGPDTLFRYKDDEGDLVTLDSDEELKEALQLVTDGSINRLTIVVSACSGTGAD